MNVAHARVLVVGGVRRLGGALALDLAGHGAAVCITSRRQGEATDEQLVALREAGAEQAAVACGDPGVPLEAARLVAEAAAALGGLDALVYAASGPFAPTPPERLDEAGWDGSFDTIAKGFLFAAQAARKHMLAERRSDRDATRGVIIALTDPLGLQPSPSFTAHGAAKAAQIHLVRTLACSWAADGIRVCGVAPGPVDLPDDKRRDASLRAAARTAAQRLVPAADVGATVRYCLEVDSVTGANVIVDNGCLVTV